MSYARFGWGGSTVYVYHHVDDYLICQGCSLSPTHNFTTVYRLEMMDHLYDHRKAGQTVPESALDKLSDEFVKSGNDVTEE